MQQAQTAAEAAPLSARATAGRTASDAAETVLSRGAQRPAHPLHGPMIAARNGLPASEFPSPWWPAASVLTIVFMGLVIAILGAFEDTRVALYVGAVWLGLLVVAYSLWVRGRVRAELVDETAGETGRTAPVHSAK